MGCIGFIDSYRFSSSILDWLVERLVDNELKTPMNLREEVVGDDNIINSFNEIETLISKNRYDNDFIEDLERAFSIKLWKTEEV